MRERHAGGATEWMGEGREIEDIYYADTSSTDTNHRLLSHSSKPCCDPTLGSISAVTHTHIQVKCVCVCVVVSRIINRLVDRHCERWEQLVNIIRHGPAGSSECLRAAFFSFSHWIPFLLLVCSFFFFFELQINESGANTDARIVSQSSTNTFRGRSQAGLGRSLAGSDGTSKLGPVWH